MPIPTIMGEFSQSSNSIRLSGLWVSTDKKFDNIKIISEDMNCDNRVCDSSRGILYLLGQQNPLLFGEYSVYDIISNKNNIYILTNDSGYTITINLKSKVVKKTKIFDNGDINDYILITDQKKIDQEIKRIIESCKKSN